MTLDAYDTRPLFNLRAVVQQTGLKPATLRAWERRYGLPTPARTPGGHRLYSPRDVAILRWLQARLEEGMSISQAAALYRRLEAEGRDPLIDRFASASVTPAASGCLDQLQHAWVEACMAFDEAAAERVLAAAFAQFPVETVCLQVLRGGLAEVGERWYRAEATVHQEHFASALAMRRVEALLATTPPPSRPTVLLLACVPGEEHAFPLAVLNLFLRRRGLRVLYLGPDTPWAEMPDTAGRLEPDLVLLCAERLPTAARLADSARHLAEHGLALAYGGGVFERSPSLRASVPGHYLGALEAAVQAIERLLLETPPAPEARVSPYLDLRAAYHDVREEIEAQVWKAMVPEGIPASDLSRANAELAAQIDAALLLGDLAVLGQELDWVRGLLRHRNLPVAWLDRHVAAYAEYLSQALGPQALPLVEALTPRE